MTPNTNTERQRAEEIDHSARALFGQLAAIREPGSGPKLAVIRRFLESYESAALTPPTAIQPDMWWDPESPEEAITDPQEAFDDNQWAEAGDTFRLWCAKRLPDQIYTIIPDGLDGLMYREATPEEAAEHIAHEKEEKARRKAECDAQNAARKSALSSPRQEKGEVSRGK